MASRTLLMASSALALVLCTAPGFAQQKDGMPSGSATGGEGRAAQKEQGQKGSEATEPKGKGMTQGETKGQTGKSTTQSEPKDKSKGTAESQQKEPGTKGTAQTQPKDPSTKGRADTQQPKEPSGKGTAESPQKEPGTKGSAQTQPKEPGTKGRAETQQPKEPGGKGTATETGKGTGPKGSDTAKGPSGERMQLSQEQRTNVHSTITKESNVNRATNVNVSVNVGSRVPQSVRLAPLPAAVISAVPHFRSYQYFVANDQICIVDPRSHEIVEVISEPSRSASTGDRGGMTRLTLTEEEKAIILREVEMNGGSTMGLGALREGGEVPRSAQVRPFPDTVVQRIPKVEGYKYVAAENRVAIVDPQGSKIQLVIEDRR
jgi:Protein of unknown function (DUF1236)